jgi:hypothetical protein
MKLFIISFLIFLYLCPLFSQEKKDEQSSGVSVGLVIKPSIFKNGFAFLTGVKMGLTFNENYYAGIALYGITFQQYKPDVIDILDSSSLYPNLELSYYGFEFEYNLNPQALFSPSFLIFSGFYINSLNIPNIVINSANYNPDYKESNNSFIIEPSINMSYQDKSFYRVTLGLSYRYFIAVNRLYRTLARSDRTPFIMDNSELNGISFSVIIRFGSF